MQDKKSDAVPLARFRIEIFHYFGMGGDKIGWFRVETYTNMILNSVFMFIMFKFAPVKHTI